MRAPMPSKDWPKTRESDNAARDARKRTPGEGWRVSYEIVTPESAAEGEAEERGMITEGEGVTLRHALQLATGSLSHYAAESANEWPIRAPRWFDFDFSECFQTGAHERRSLHVPDSITPASRRRLARLLGVK